jgi:hypothetical protein
MVYSRLFNRSFTLFKKEKCESWRHKVKLKKNKKWENFFFYWKKNYFQEILLFFLKKIKILD